MKIDIHVHTKKTKTGDATTREISPSKFCEIVLSTDVKILCITNHNVFDLTQFSEIASGLENNAQVWPGVELDITDEGVNGHLLVVVSPKDSVPFSEAVIGLTENTSPDTFITTIEKVVEAFDDYGPLYIAHYKQKKPNISESTLEKLLDRTNNPSRIIKEVTNSISAGIYISHGYPSIYGSDVQNWERYAELSYRLPELRLPVESFEHFCLLLEKDPVTINTVLDKKTSETLKLVPFDDETEIRLTAYNDINIIFGSKGTGKSCILKAISKHYSDKGIDAKVFTPANDLLDQIYDIKGKDITINLLPFGINYCTDEFEAIRAARETDVTSISNYVSYFRLTTTNSNAKKITLKDLEPEQLASLKREFTAYNDTETTINEFLEFLNSDDIVKKELEEADLEKVIEVLEKLVSRLKTGKWDTFSSWKETSFLNSAIKTIRREVSRKTGSPSKPSTTGFLDYARNRMEIERNIKEIISNIGKPIGSQILDVGNLGTDKGHLTFETEFTIQSGQISDSSLNSMKGVRKTTQKSCSKSLQKIARNVYEDNLFEYIAELNEIDEIDDIKGIYELLLFKRYFSLDGVRYSPSSGESAMLMLQKELCDEKDVYILDEPEKSLGNEYINDVIVPMLKEKARIGKKVFLSTHDANIAVRTLPYSSVYRNHNSAGYATFVGNPFSNNLTNIEDENDSMDWKEISMKTLEGGVEAFGERGKIYGKN